MVRQRQNQTVMQILMATDCLLFRRNWLNLTGNESMNDAWREIIAGS